MPSASDTLIPPVATTAAGHPRRVGVEIEFGELDVDAAARVLVDIFGGEIIRHTDYEIAVVTPESDEFRVEVDMALLKRMGQKRTAAGSNSGLLERMPEEVLAAFARQLVPCEIVTPPLPFASLIELDGLVERLREAGALGTEDALLYAFGLHFNPEAPSLEAESVLAYLRAFVLLYDWLKQQLRVDPARRVTPFIRPYPNRYVRRLVDAGYAPTTAELIDDYLAYNPTRNRALDLLPLFAHVDRERVFAVVNDPAIKARPAYHYRLSNSQVSNPRWRLTDQWRYWLAVEALAHDRELLAAMATDYCALVDRPLGDLFSDWTARTRTWLDKLRTSSVP